MIRSGASVAASPNPRQTEKSTIKKVVGLPDFARIQSTITIIFIHYHPDEYVAPGFVKLVRSAIESGYRAIFVSTARPSRALPQLGEYSSVTYIHRDNYGYDFGALKDARDIMKEHGLLSNGRYVVLNSSMLNLASAGFGSDWVLDELCAPREKADLLGITASYEVSGYHIQTYFYSASSEWFNSPEFDNFLRSYYNGLGRTKLSPREYAISAGELTLSHVAMNAGYVVRSLHDDLCLPTKECFEQVESLRAAVSRLVPQLDSYIVPVVYGSTSNPACHQFEWLPRLGLQSNPSQSCWALLLFRNVLFIKRELLEVSHVKNHHAPSIVALLMLFLEACEVKIPDWSDIHALPRLIHSSRARESKDNHQKTVRYTMLTRND